MDLTQSSVIYLVDVWRLDRDGKTSFGLPGALPVRKEAYYYSQFDPVNMNAFRPAPPPPPDFPGSVRGNTGGGFGGSTSGGFVQGGSTSGGFGNSTSGGFVPPQPLVIGPVRLPLDRFFNQATIKWEGYMYDLPSWNPNSFETVRVSVTSGADWLTDRELVGVNGKWLPVGTAGCCQFGLRIGATLNVRRDVNCTLLGKSLTDDRASPCEFRVKYYITGGEGPRVPRDIVAQKIAGLVGGITRLSSQLNPDTHGEMMAAAATLPTVLHSIKGISDTDRQSNTESMEVKEEAFDDALEAILQAGAPLGSDKTWNGEVYSETPTQKDVSNIFDDPAAGTAQPTVDSGANATGPSTDPAAGTLPSLSDPGASSIQQGGNQSI